MSLPDRIRAQMLAMALVLASVPTFAAMHSGAGIACHITYGGETRQVRAQPVASPYGVEAVQVGSYFLFRAVVQDSPADIASIKLYVYGDTDDGPIPIHQADYPYPPPTLRTTAFGFTGHQRVYERIRDGELEYWCHWEAARKSVK